MSCRDHLAGVIDVDGWMDEYYNSTYTQMWNGTTYVDITVNDTLHNLQKRVQRVKHLNVWRWHTLGIRPSDVNYPAISEWTGWPPNEGDMEDKVVSDAIDEYNTAYPGDVRTYYSSGINSSDHTSQPGLAYGNTTYMDQYFAATKAANIASDPYPGADFGDVFAVPGTWNDEPNIQLTRNDESMIYVSTGASDLYDMTSFVHVTLNGGATRLALETDLGMVVPYQESLKLFFHVVLYKTSWDLSAGRTFTVVPALVNGFSAQQAAMPSQEFTIPSSTLSYVIFCVEQVITNPLDLALWDNVGLFVKSNNSGDTDINAYAVVFKESFPKEVLDATSTDHQTSGTIGELIMHAASKR